MSIYEVIGHEDEDLIHLAVNIADKAAQTLTAVMVL